MKRTLLWSIAFFACAYGSTRADTFGTDNNEFDIEFVTISGATNPSVGIYAGTGFTFRGVANDYRIGKFEITAAQWTKFKTANGKPTGNPSTAYDQDSYVYGMQPINLVSWFEAAQFVNWLNTSTGHSAAYKFTGTQGATDYTFSIWDATDVGYNPGNPYRNSNAFYFLPTENEWVKAAYWNGTRLQNYATIGNVRPIAGTDTNYDYAIGGIWSVSRGTMELNGTYNMMGNVLEWTENPYVTENFTIDSARTTRGGQYVMSAAILSSYRHDVDPAIEGTALGFRVASVPEPATLILLSLGGLALHRKR